MTKEELQIRIDKKNKDIEKIQKRINKWTVNMNDEAKKLVQACEVTSDDPSYKSVMTAARTYNRINGDDVSVNNPDDWNKGPNMQEAIDAYRALADAKTTLDKYNKELAALTDFQNSDKVDIIWKFLMNWRKEAYNFYINNVKKYAELKKEYDSKLDEFMNKPETIAAVENAPINRKATFKMHLRNDFTNKYYSGIETLTKNISNGFGDWDNNKLNKVLDKDVQNKYNKFIDQITEKAGNILDITGLHIGPKGDINGYVIGDKNKVHVETILAGGYNIQILHYRTLVNVIK